jgi:hypothetical protein
MTLADYGYDQSVRFTLNYIGKLAGNGNRTRMASLEGWNFTIKLCPHRDSE